MAKFATLQTVTEIEKGNWLIKYYGKSKETGRYIEYTIQIKDENHLSAKQRTEKIISSYLDNYVFVSLQPLNNHLIIH